jgi:NADH dehydrogenase/NADH:ubiquinone oxidoreductase subunit G
MLASNNSQQLCELLKTLNPQTANALTELLKQYALSQQQQQQPQLPQRHQPNSASQHQQNANASSAANNPTVSAAQQAKEAKAKEAAMQAATENALKTAREQTQQKISAARHQMRHDLEQQLSMLRPPKAPVPDMYFIPNGNQPDFCYLLGLDLTVQRVLKDKSIFK